VTGCPMRRGDDPAIDALPRLRETSDCPATLSGDLSILLANFTGPDHHPRIRGRLIRSEPPRDRLYP
jgi:hypothetical protein